MVGGDTRIASMSSSDTGVNEDGIFMVKSQVTEIGDDDRKVDFEYFDFEYFSSRTCPKISAD